MEKNTRITMKQYTTPEQTAKLIELGVEKPTIAAPSLKWVDGEPTFEPQYTIGELIDILPDATCRSNNDDIHYYLTIYNDAMDWNIAYRDSDDELCHIVADELIDALYDMVIKLKDEEVI